MKKHNAWQWVSVGVLLSVFAAASAYGHGEGGGGAKNLTEVPFVPNPNVPEFADAKGTASLSLAEGVIQLEDLEGFPFDTTRNRIIPINVTSTTDPRFKNSDGSPTGTSCHPASISESQEPIGPWTCHTHSYVVWLAGLEDGVLEHPLPIGIIFPRTDGTAADRNFSFREGDLTGFGANVVIITAEVTFGAVPSVSQGSDGSIATNLVPQGPIVLQANLE